MGGVVVVVERSIEAARCGDGPGSISALGWPRKAVAITTERVSLIVTLSLSFFFRSALMFVKMRLADFEGKATKCRGAPFGHIGCIHPYECVHTTPLGPGGINPHDTEGPAHLITPEKN